MKELSSITGEKGLKADPVQIFNQTMLLKHFFHDHGSHPHNATMDLTSDAGGISGYVTSRQVTHKEGCVVTFWICSIAWYTLRCAILPLALLSAPQTSFTIDQLLWPIVTKPDPRLHRCNRWLLYYNERSGTVLNKERKDSNRVPEEVNGQILIPGTNLETSVSTKRVHVFVLITIHHNNSVGPCWVLVNSWQ